jgi:hypothetical protein
VAAGYLCSGHYPLVKLCGTLLSKATEVKTFPRVIRIKATYRSDAPRASRSALDFRRPTFYEESEMFHARPSLAALALMLLLSNAVGERHFACLYQIKTVFFLS